MKSFTLVNLLVLLWLVAMVSNLNAQISFCDGFEGDYTIDWQVTEGLAVVATYPHSGVKSIAFNGSGGPCWGIMYRKNFAASFGEYSVWTNRQPGSYGSIFAVQVPIGGGTAGGYRIDFAAGEAFYFFKEATQVGSLATFFPTQQWVQVFIRREPFDIIIYGYRLIGGGGDSATYYDPAPITTPGTIVLQSCSAGNVTYFDDVCFQEIDPSYKFAEHFEDGSGFQSRWTAVSGLQSIVQYPAFSGSGALQMQASLDPSDRCNSVMYANLFEGAQGTYSAHFFQFYEEGGGALYFQVQSDPDNHPELRPGYCLRFRAIDSPAGGLFELVKNDGAGGAAVLGSLNARFHLQEWVNIYAERLLGDSIIIGYQTDSVQQAVLILDDTPLTGVGRFYVTSCSNTVPPYVNYWDDICFNRLYPDEFCDVFESPDLASRWTTSEGTVTQSSGVLISGRHDAWGKVYRRQFEEEYGEYSAKVHIGVPPSNAEIKIQYTATGQHYSILNLPTAFSLYRNSAVLLQSLPPTYSVGDWIQAFLRIQRNGGLTFGYRKEDGSGDSTYFVYETPVSGPGRFMLWGYSESLYDNVCFSVGGDQDNDLIPEDLDNCPSVYNPNQLNADGDSMGDACDQDDDNDGILDVSDNCPLTTNPLQENLDNDGFGDVCDNDIDGDGLSNAEEAAIGSDPQLHDTDGDGVDDSTEVYADGGSVTVPGDTDQDGIFDVLDTDDDGDGILTLDEDTDRDGDPTDDDTDSDGIPDYLDTESDGDGVLDKVDNCPYTPNSGQENADQDGKGDACDNCWLVQNADQQDTDGDCAAPPYSSDPRCGDACETCCSGRVGDANGVGTYPQEVTISDIQLLVTAKFISSLPCEQNLHCLTEADVNQSGGASPACKDITISDIQTLVNHLFIAGPANAPLKDCL